MGVAFHEGLECHVSEGGMVQLCLVESGGTTPLVLGGKEISS